MTNSYLYHYTTVSRLHKIIADGKLKATENGITRKNFWLWFSKNQIWEPTATSLVRTERGEVKDLNLQQLHENMGIARIGISKLPELVTWAKYRHVSREPSFVLDGFEKRGIGKGARPSDWFA